MMGFAPERHSTLVGREYSLRKNSPQTPLLKLIHGFGRCSPWGCHHVAQLRRMFLGLLGKHHRPTHRLQDECLRNMTRETHMDSCVYQSFHYKKDVGWSSRAQSS